MQAVCTKYPCVIRRLVVWFTAILTYLPVLPFQTIIIKIKIHSSCEIEHFVGYCRLLSQMNDFMPMIFTVPMWGSEVANSKAEIHLTNTASEVGMRCHHY